MLAPGGVRPCRRAPPARRVRSVSAIQFLVLLVLAAAIVVSPVFTIAAWARIRRLERDVDELRRAWSGATPASPEPGESSAAGDRPVAPGSQPAPDAPATSLAASGTGTAEAAGADVEGIIGGRWLNRVGLFTVAVGVSFFLKLAIDNGWIGPRGQVVSGLVLGAGLATGSQWFRTRGYGYFADGVLALGAVVLYLSVWAAGSYYHLVSEPLTFGGLAIVTVVIAVLAVERNSRGVAVLALLGGFLTPVLVATGRDDQVLLFFYLAALDGSLLPAAGIRDWRFLEWPAFVFTQLYFWGWFDRFYRPESEFRTSFFAVLFFVVLAALPLLRNRLGRRFRPEHVLLILLNGGAWAVAFFAMLWPRQSPALTMALLALAAAHLGAAVLAKTGPGQAGLARAIYASAAVALVAVVVPVELEGHWIAIGWAVEGAALMAVGARTAQRYVRGLAMLLLLVVCVRVVVIPMAGETFLWNARLATAGVTVACLGVTLWLARAPSVALGHEERLALGAIAVAINVVAVWALTLEVMTYFAPLPMLRVESHAQLATGVTISLVWIAYASGLMIAGVRRRVAGLRWQSLALFGLTTVKLFTSDLARLSGGYRVVSSIALGVVLLAISFVYQRRRAGSGVPGR